MLSDGRAGEGPESPAGSGGGPGRESCRGPGPGAYSSVLVTGVAVGIGAGVTAAGMGVAPTVARAVACAYFARMSRIRDWYDEVRMILSNWPR